MLLPCFRMNLQQEKTPSGLVLYHFVGSETSVSADPIFMIRRLTSQVLMMKKWFEKVFRRKNEQQFFLERFLI